MPQASGMSVGAVGWALPAAHSIRRQREWGRFLRFCTVGASGYLLNLSTFVALVATGLDPRAAAVGAFAVAVTNNYAWNRAWTFRDRRGGVLEQGFRFLVVSLLALAGNVLMLMLLLQGGVGELPAQASAIVLVTPVNFLGNRLWSFARRSNR